VAVINQAARRCQRPGEDAIGIRARLEFVVLGHLQVPEAHAEHAEQDEDDQEPDHRPAREHGRFLATILDRPELHVSCARKRARMSSSSRNTNGQASMPMKGETQKPSDGIGSPEKPRTMITTMRSLRSRASTARACWLS